MLQKTIVVGQIACDLILPLRIGVRRDTRDLNASRVQLHHHHDVIVVKPVSDQTSSVVGSTAKRFPNEY
ncbi:hypothetical protein Pla110_18110 [Polystyrenella longa]|uniref:Uncharacterized protein n=1 Tax=Polystyrenella longa TaxID=2528007 RepID=A0A518CLI5_9PLAN|nr:hypothetical protein [Polystyrenella longa]QDU80089.1 hypothetical protein Pla110_18110 [Polystyrenella longa]